MGQGPATEMTHLRLNQPPVFSSAIAEGLTYKSPYTVNTWYS